MICPLMDEAWYTDMLYGILGPSDVGNHEQYFSLDLCSLPHLATSNHLSKTRKDVTRELTRWPSDYMLAHDRNTTSWGKTEPA